MRQKVTASNRRDPRWKIDSGAFLLIFIVSAGCASSATPLAEVSGKVTLAGTPLTAGTVLFMTDSGNAASAELKSDGTYLLRTQPGRFKVAVTPPAPPDPLAAGAAPPIPSAGTPAIPKRYHDFGTSGLSIDVKQGKNTLDIALNR